VELVEQTGRTRSINRGHWQLNDLETRLADSDAPQRQMLEHIKRIIACRARQPALAAISEQHVCPSMPGTRPMNASIHVKPAASSAGMPPSAASA